MKRKRQRAKFRIGDKVVVKGIGTGTIFEVSADVGGPYYQLNDCRWYHELSLEPMERRKAGKR